MEEEEPTLREIFDPQIEKAYKEKKYTLFMKLIEEYKDCLCNEIDTLYANKRRLLEDPDSE